MQDSLILFDLILLCQQLVKHCHDLFIWGCVLQRHWSMNISRRHLQI